MGIEPTLSAWEAEVLPLNYTRPNCSDVLVCGGVVAYNKLRTFGLEALPLEAALKIAALVILGLRGARNPHVLLVHSGSCAPGAPNLTALATFLRQLLSPEKCRE